MWWGGVMHGREVCIAGGACVAGGEHVWQGACMAGRGHACVAGEMATAADVRYASYWNAFFFFVTSKVRAF